MTRTFIDVNIPMYAAGAPHPLREPSQRVIMAIATGQLDAVTDAEVFQEILYRYIHIGEREKGFRVFDHFYRIMAGRILPIDEADLQQARNLAERCHPQHSRCHPPGRHEAPSAPRHHYRRHRL